MSRDTQSEEQEQHYICVVDYLYYPQRHLNPTATYCDTSTVEVEPQAHCLFKICTHLPGQLSSLLLNILSITTDGIDSPIGYPGYGLFQLLVKVNPVIAKLGTSDPYSTPSTSHPDPLLFLSYICIYTHICTDIIPVNCGPSP